MKIFMSKIERIRTEFVEFIPKTPAGGILYVSRRFNTATHLCCCGCGNKVVTPLKPGGWQLTVRRNEASLYPSIGSWSLPCQSHYIIRDGRIVWAKKFSKKEIAAVRINDQRAREQHYNGMTQQNNEPVWLRTWKWLMSMFR